MQIQKETYLKANREAREEILFDILVNLDNKLSNLKRHNKTISAVCGLIGGACAVLAGKVPL